MTTTTMTALTSSPTEASGRPRIVPLVGDEPAMRDWAAELVERARMDGVELTGENGLFTALVRQVLQTGFEDVDGQGHVTTVVSPTPATLMAVPIAD
jgi:hypothetical protein